MPHIQPRSLLLAAAAAAAEVRGEEERRRAGEAGLGLLERADSRLLEAINAGCCCCCCCAEEEAAEKASIDIGAAAAEAGPPPTPSMTDADGAYANAGVGALPELSDRVLPCMR